MSGLTKETNSRNRKHYLVSGLNRPLVHPDEALAGDLFSSINEDNFLLFAARNYINPLCYGVDEFNEDIGKIYSIKKLLTRHYNGNKRDMNERLFLNYVIMIFNVFEKDAAKVMLFYKTERTHWSALKTAMVFLGFMRIDELEQIPIDEIINQKLEAL